MGMQVNTNIAANNAYRNLATTQNDLSKSLEKLSSGLRINRAADDAAGLAISEGLKSQVGGLTVASRNAQDAISVIQTAEGSLNEVTSILQRMRDLAVQAGNDSNNGDSREAIETEVNSLKDELTRIASSTNFNGTALLNGDVDENGGTKLNFQVGASNDPSSQIAVDLAGADVTDVVAGLNFSTATGSQFSTAASAALNAPSTKFTQGGTTVTVAAPANGYADKNAMVAALNSDENFAKNFTASLNDAQELVVTSEMSGSDTIAISQNTSGAVGTFGADLATTGTPDTAGFDSAAAAQISIGLIDDQIKEVSSARADLGASQNRFESVIKNLAVSKENLTAAGSRIRDTDMAEEMVKYTRANILSQAGTAMLAQANQSNSGVLQLLQ